VTQRRTDGEAYIQKEEQEEYEEMVVVRDWRKYRVAEGLSSQLAEGAPCPSHRTHSENADLARRARIRCYLGECQDRVRQPVLTAEAAAFLLLLTARRLIALLSRIEWPLIRQESGRESRSIFVPRSGVDSGQAGNCASDSASAQPTARGVTGRASERSAPAGPHSPTA